MVGLVFIVGRLKGNLPLFRTLEREKGCQNTTGSLRRDLGRGTLPMVPEPERSGCWWGCVSCEVNNGRIPNHINSAASEMAFLVHVFVTRLAWGLEVASFGLASSATPASLRTVAF
eukprot:3289180-Rhodomonas_salina.1